MFCKISGEDACNILCRKNRICARHGVFHIDSAAGVFNDEDFKAFFVCVQRGGSDAKIISESGDKNALHAFSAEMISKTGGGGVIVVGEGGVGIDMQLLAFANDKLGIGDVQCGVQRGACGLLHAVIGPQHLLAVGGGDAFEDGVAGVRGGEGDVSGGVPVLREDDVGEARRERVEGRDDGIAIGNCKCAPGAEVILDIDDEDGVCWLEDNRLHGFHRKLDVWLRFLNLTMRASAYATLRQTRWAWSITPTT